jgi:phospholipid-binding lipoprotein MlaA
MNYSQIFILVVSIALSVPWSVGAAAAVPGQVVVGGDPVEGSAEAVSAGHDEPGSEYLADHWLEEDWYAEIKISDPLEPVNRVFFYFNDKLYFWVLRPLAQTYSFVAPKPVRKCVGNFFHNLKMPIRFTNNVLQGKLVAGGSELTRFLVNSTAGVVGLWDPARKWLDLSANEEDFGQTLGKYGIGGGFYICWPVLGPSNVRDTLGTVGDYFLDPVSYLGFNGEEPEGFAVRSFDAINKTSLKLGDYEAFKNATFDPYSATRDAYFQSRRSKIKDGEE